MEVTEDLGEQAWVQRRAPDTYALHVTLKGIMSLQPYHPEHA